MNILNSYKRTRFFLWVNITGLAIGLAASIMLILFVVSELSYDRHFDGHERIVRLINKVESDGNVQNMAITLRKAYTEVPQKVSGIEAATQIFNNGRIELMYEKRHYQQLVSIDADSSFFKVFKMKFLAGTPEQALQDINSVVITDKQAKIIFGNVAYAIGKTVNIGRDYTVSAVVEELPKNTHFTFDVIGNIQSLLFYDSMQGLEFLTYFKIRKDANFMQVRADIEREYTAAAQAFSESTNLKTTGLTERLDDIYLHSDASYSIGKHSDSKLVKMLILIAFFILLLAVVNFINLFTSQCETRLLEIGIRKTNGASANDIVKLFFVEVAVVVFIAFAAGLFLAVASAPYFAELIRKDIDLQQLLRPTFLLCAVGLYVFTVTIAASYPAFYTSRFAPLDILAKRLKFSKRRLTTALLVFQSVVTIVLLSFILVINNQTTYLKNLPLNYDNNNVMMVLTNSSIFDSYKAIRSELLNISGVKQVSAAGHIIGSSWSGQLIATAEDRENRHGIYEYRIMPGICEIMDFRLVDGEFFKENEPDSIVKIVLNEAAVTMLGLKPPYSGQYVYYKDIDAEVIGVVKDFIYGEPAKQIEPLVLTTLNAWPSLIYIRFDENISRNEAPEIAAKVFRNFDSEFIVNPLWSEDFYNGKFGDMNMQFCVALIGSLLSVFIAMIGLLATHLYTARRRTKEIGIRRINGATVENIFRLLSWDVLKWIAVAGMLAAPVSWYVASGWLENYGKHISLGVAVFMLPLFAQCLIAVAVTSGVSLSVSMKNPVNSIKSE